MKNNIRKALYCGRHFEFSSINNEKSLVTLPARHKRERPDDVFFMIKLFRNDMRVALVIKKKLQENVRMSLVVVIEV